MKKRRGVVLLITIGFITAITALIGYQFSIVDNGLKRTSSEKFYYQSSLLLADIQQKLIPEVLKELKSMDTNDSQNKDIIAQTISGYYNVPFPIINDEKIGNAVITITPADTKFNINNLKKLSSEKRVFFENFTQDLEDPILITDMIDLVLETNDTISSSYEYLKNENNLQLNSIFFRRGEIVNIEQFNTILDNYYTMTKDKKIYSLNWDEVFSFESYNKKMVFSEISYEFCKTIFSYKDSEWIGIYCTNNQEDTDSDEEIIPPCEEIASDDEDNITLSSYNIVCKNYNPIIQISVDIMQNENSANFKFMYDIEKSKAFNLKIEKL